MSKTTQRKQSHAPKPKPKPEAPKSKTWIPILLCVVLAAIPFSLGKYFEFNSPGVFDSGAYVHSAAKILNGAEIGVDEKPSAQVGTLLMNMLGVWIFGYSDMGPKLMQMCLQIAALTLMFLALRKAFGIGAAGLGIFITAFYLSSPLLAKFGNVKEQFMITFMIMGVSCFVLYLCSGRWWWAVLAGATLAWGPLFKQTALSAVGGVGVFVLLQPLLKNNSWKQMGRDIGLLLAGVVVGIGPLYVWMLAGQVQMTMPYAFLYNILLKPLLSSGDTAGPATAGYVSTSRSLIPFSEQWPRVLRYYGVVGMPIVLALGAIGVRLYRWIKTRLGKEVWVKQEHERLVLLLAGWWFLDMAFVWISPRSYEQYYLPLNASAAMLSGYLVAMFVAAYQHSVRKPRWTAIGCSAFAVMVLMSWHVVFGIKKSPHSGTKYPEARKGYVQTKKQIDARRKPGARRGAWEVLSEYIRTNSEPDDRMYVWGWYPGINVEAQRLSPASRAFEANMHV
ncbi:MAG: hypothetical protein MI922_01230, partial [Bacteroidales bacterium]|nr:hypothetical protein [Bacteroidales bacterium]